MKFSTFLFRNRNVPFFLSMLIVTLIFLSCKKEKDAAQERDSILDEVIGTHSGTCHYVYKNLATGETYVDSTYDSTVEIIRNDAETIRATGCAAPLYSFSMPIGSTKTEFFSQQTVANQQEYVLSIKINLLDRTITTSSSYTPNFTAYSHIRTGIHKF